MKRPPLSKHERKVRSELHDVSVALGFVPAAGGCNPAESEFVARALSNGANIYRAGWPDFLIESKGQTFAVEVKSGSDIVSTRQATMFEMLEKFGLRVLIWDHDKPGALTPWRRSPRSRRAIKAGPQKPRYAIND